MKRSCTKLIFKLGFFIIAGLLCQSCNTQNDSKQALVSNTGKPAALPYQYAPAGCQFKITFPSEPDIKDVTQPTNPHNVSMEVAKLLVQDDSTFISANFELYDQSFNTASQTTLLKMLKKEAELKGLKDADVRYEPDSLGTCFMIQGSRIVEGVNTMYSDRWYFKNNNLFSISVVCPAALYPTTTATAFFASLKLADK